MRGAVSYPSSNRGLPFEAKRYGKGDDLSSYQLVTTSTSSKKANERENEEDEKMGHGGFLQLQREIIEDTKKRTALEKKIITNGFMLESVNDN